MRNLFWFDVPTRILMRIFTLSVVRHPRREGFRHDFRVHREGGAFADDVRFEQTTSRVDRFAELNLLRHVELDRRDVRDGPGGVRRAGDADAEVRVEENREAAACTTRRKQATVRVRLLRATELELHDRRFADGRFDANRSASAADRLRTPSNKHPIDSDGIWNCDSAAELLAGMKTVFPATSLKRSDVVVAVTCPSLRRNTAWLAVAET